MTTHAAHIQRLSMLLLGAVIVAQSPAVAQEEVQQSETTVPQFLDASAVSSDHSLKRPRENQLSQLRLSLRYEQYRSQVAQQGFAAAEEALQSDLAVAEDQSEAVVDLATFYMAHGLNEEALSLLGEQIEIAADERSLYLAGVAAYQAERYETAVNWLNNALIVRAPEVRPWRGMAYAALGAYSQAAPDLFSARVKDASAGAGVSQFHLARAATAIALEDAKSGGEALSDLRRTALNDRQRGERTLLEARHQLLIGRKPAARDILTRLSKYGEQASANRASLLLIALDVQAAKMPAVVAAKKVDALLLQWRGGAFELEALFQLGELCDAGGKFECAFVAWRRLQNTYPHADLTQHAKSKMTDLLVRLAQEASLSPLAAAQIFYDNIDLAPPGRDGDQLIQRLARDLVALDLHAQAAELLEHQVFNRLRGAERATAAGGLAEIYLNDDRPDEALRVLRSSRFARLPDPIVARRRLMEATALWRLDKAEAALARLDEDESFNAVQLRGDIYWRQSNWEQAGTAYAAAAMQLATDGVTFSEREHTLVLRAAAALSLAGDDEGVTALEDAVAPNITNSKVLDVFYSLKAGASAETLMQFGESYRSVFSKAESAS